MPSCFGRNNMRLSVSVRGACSPLARCASFIRVWDNVRATREVAQALDAKLVGAAPGVTFWRPLPPIGYAVLGDCVTAGPAQPSFQVRLHSGLQPQHLLAILAVPHLRSCKGASNTSSADCMFQPAC